MSKKIDERVVEMQFDNKQFERNVSTTMSTLDKLKSSLKLDGASKGLENVQTAASKVNFAPLSSAVEAVGLKFNAMYTIADQALRNITNSAMQAGKNIVSAFTIDPIKTGFEEYETQINAVQTILANTQGKGGTLSGVNAALDELNKYADQTIYNFTEMTRNIGTFTAAGVDLDKSVTSIKGIANLAAVSGSTSQQASTAMYQLSQALAAGKVQLMDWNSVVNAGMGGQVFQDALKRTATQMGTNVDALIEKYGSFRESLTKGEWLTAEVLTETLTQLSGAYTEADLIAQGYSKEQAKQITELAQTAVDAATKVKTFTQLWDTLKEAAQSGWTETWEILVGDFEEAKELLTELSETFGSIIQSSADARNNLLYDAMTSNWKKITDGITEAGLSAEDFQTKVKEVAKDQKIDVDSIVEEYGSLEKAFKNGALSSDLLDKALVKMTGTTEEIAKKMADLRGEYKSNADLIKALTKAGYEQSDIQNLITKDTQGQTIALNDLSDAQLMSIGYTTEQVASIRELATYSELANGSLSKFIDNVSVQNGREMLVDVLRVSLRSLIAVFEVVGKAWREVFPPTTSDQLLGVIESVRNFALSLRPSEETLNKLQRTFRGLFSVLSIAKQAIGAILSPIGSLIGDIAGLSGGILDATASFGDWLFAMDQSIKAGDSFSSVSKIISTALGKIMDGVHAVIDSVGGMSGIFSSIGDGIAYVFNGVLNVVGRVADWIRDNISTGDIFAGLAGGGIFLLAQKFSGLVDKLKEGFEGFLDIFKGGEGGGFADILGSIHDSLESFQQGIQVASLVGIATAVMLLTSSLRTISEIEPAKLAYSLTTIQLMIMSLNSGFKSLTKTLSKFKVKGTLTAAVAMIAMAEAINILADAMTTIAKMDLGEIAKGLIGVSGGITILSAAIKFISGSKITLRTSVGILAMAQACKMLAEALGGFAELSWDEIARGLTAMGIALAEFTVVLSVLGKTGGLKSVMGATGMLIAAQALDEISENLEKLGMLPWGVIGRGLTAMGVALAEFTAALSILSKVGGFGAVLGGTAILIAVQSLDEISENLERLGLMSWDMIGRGLTSMGIALAEFTAALAILSKVGGFGAVLGGTAILIAAQSLEDIAVNLNRLGKMEWGEIGRGLTAMAGALVELGVVSGALGKLAGFSGILGSTSILIAVQGLEPIANSLQKLGDMTWSEIGRGLSAMGGALAEVAIIGGVLGSLTHVFGILGSTSLLIGIQGLDELATALKKFGSMSWDEIGRGLSAMAGALSEVAIGGLLNTLSVIGGTAISDISVSLGYLADSVLKWKNVIVPDGLAEQLGSLATGVSEFMFAGWGAGAIATVAEPLGAMADSVRKWSGVTVPVDLGSNLKVLASGINEFMFGGFGAGALSDAAPGVGAMADAVKKWSGVTVPLTLKDGLTGIAEGVKAFSFAFMGGWSISSLIEPLGSLPDAVKKWNGVKLPANLKENLTNLADGVNSFGFAFVGGWSIGSIVEPLGNLADAVDKWSGVSIAGLGPELSKLSAGLKDLISADLSAKFARNLGDLFDTFANPSVTTAVSNIGAATRAFNQMANIDVSGISTFQTAMTKLGEVSVDGLVQKLQNGASDVGAAITVLITTMQTTLTGGSGSIGSSATTLGNTIGKNVVSGVKNGLGTLSSVMSTMIISATTTAASSASSNVGTFRTIGSMMSTNLTSGFTSKVGTLNSSVTNVVSGLLNAISGKASNFNSAGGNLVTQFASGIKTKQSTALNAFTAIITSLVTAIASKNSQFNKAGQNLMATLTSGAQANGGKFTNAFVNAVNSAVSSVRSHYQSFYSAGTYLAQGFADGITANSFGAAQRAAEMARAAYQASMSALNAHSPSRLFMEVGSYVALGFANGIDGGTKTVEDSASGMARSALDSTKKAISMIADAVENGIDSQPTIRPVLDLSSVEAETSKLNAMFSRSKAISINSRMKSDNDSSETNQNGSNQPVGNVTFTQNNYSPKALSRFEIYRQTRNQISTIERMLRR